MIDLRFLGYVASFISIVSFLPQVYKSFKSRKTKDISLLTFLFLTLGALLWFVYGILIHDAPVILTNGILLTLESGMVLLKLKYG